LLFFSAPFPQNAAAATAADQEKEFLGQLRSRGLSRLLEAEIKRYLTTPDLNRADRIALTLELASLISERGNRAADGAARSALWKESDDWTARLLGEQLGLGQRPLIRYRAAALLITRAQRMHDLGLALPKDEEVRASERQWALAAAEHLEAAVNEAEQALNEIGSADPAGSDDLKPSDLGSLIMAGRFRLGEAKVAVARSVVTDTQREQAAKEAEPLLQQVISTGASSSAVTDARLALAELYLVTGRLPDALSLLSEPANVGGSDDEKARVALMRAKLQIANGEADEALKTLDGFENPPPWAEWQFVLFESLWKNAFKSRSFAPGEANGLRRRAMGILDKLASDYGNYWNLRGEALIADSLPSDFQSDDLSILERYARVLKNQGRLDDAAATLDRAAELANQAKDAEAAARIGFEGALVLVQAGQYDLAADRLLKLAEVYPKDERAPKALLAAAYAIARNYQKGKSKDLLLKYQDVLQKHLVAYADDPATAPEVHWLLGELLERQKNWDQAIRHYQEIPPDDRRFPTSLEAVAGIIHDRVLEKLEEGDPQTQQRVGQAISFLEKVSRDPPPSLVQSEQGRDALAIARFVLSRLLSLRSVGRSDDAERLLKEQVVGADGLQPAIRARAWTLLLELQIERGQIDEAIVTIRDGFPEAESRLIRILRDLPPLGDAPADEAKRSRIALIEALTKRTLPVVEKLKDSDRRDVRLLEAEMYRAKNDGDSEFRVLSTLRAEFPRDRPIAKALAEAQMRRGLYQESLATWEQLAKGLPRGGQEWLEVVHQMITCYLKLGRKEYATSVYKTTISLYPDLGSDTLRAKYHKLGRKLGVSQ
jgi:tetratricopeptide (TPR) repeat protein